MELSLLLTPFGRAWCMGAEVDIMGMDERRAVAMAAMRLESDSLVSPVLSSDDSDIDGLNAIGVASFP